MRNQLLVKHGVQEAGKAYLKDRMERTIHVSGIPEATKLSQH